VALTLPWWSLRDGFAATRDTAGLTGDADAVRSALEESDKMADQMRTASKTEKQEAVENAGHLLNRVAAGAC
jgi:hypothetical protein